MCFVYLQDHNGNGNNGQDNNGDNPNNTDEIYDGHLARVLADEENGNAQDSNDPNGANNPNSNEQDQPERPYFDPIPVKLYLSLYKLDLSLHKSVFVLCF